MHSVEFPHFGPQKLISVKQEKIHEGEDYNTDVADFVDTSDSEEVDNPDYLFHSKKGKRKRKRKKNQGDLSATDVKQLQNVVFVLYDSNTTNSIPLLRADGDKSKSHRRNNTHRNMLDEGRNGIYTSHAVEYPLEDNIRNEVTDYYPVRKLVDYARDAETDISGMEFIGEPDMSLQERIGRLAENADKIRTSGERDGVIIPGDPRMSLCGYERGLQETGSVFIRDGASGLSDSSVAHAAEHTVQRVDLKEIEQFHESETGEADMFNTISMMRNEATEGMKTRNATMRQRFLARLFSLELEADKTWRVWGTDSRPSCEHVQQYGEKVDKRYMDDFLRPAIPYFNERPCVRGELCIGLILLHLKNFPRTASECTRTSGFVLREFMLPLPKSVERGATGSFLKNPDAVEKSDSQDDKTDDSIYAPIETKRTIGGCCVLCIIFKQTKKCWQSKRVNRTWPIQVQYFKVSTTPPYGFPKDRILPKILPKTNVPTGFREPALAFVADDYHLSTREVKSLDGKFKTEVPCYKQVARYF